MEYTSKYLAEAAQILQMLEIRATVAPVPKGNALVVSGPEAALKEVCAPLAITTLLEPAFAWKRWAMRVKVTDLIPCTPVLSRTS